MAYREEATSGAVSTWPYDSYVSKRLISASCMRERGRPRYTYRCELRIVYGRYLVSWLRRAAR